VEHLYKEEKVYNKTARKFVILFFKPVSFGFMQQEKNRLRLTEKVLGHVYFKGKSSVQFTSSCLVLQ
jgi:hypothetical protein